MHDSRSQTGAMDITQRVVVFDAADPETEATFWATLLGGTVDHDEDDWWSVRVGDDEPVCVQLAPDHQPPQWPDGLPQQVHLDLVVPALGPAHDEAMAAGATLLQAADKPDAEHGFQVYADPAGHPFYLCW